MSLSLRRTLNPREVSLPCKINLRQELKLKYKVKSENKSENQSTERFSFIECTFYRRFLFSLPRVTRLLFDRLSIRRKFQIARLYYKIVNRNIAEIWEKLLFPGSKDRFLSMYLLARSVACTVLHVTFCTCVLYVCGRVEMLVEGKDQVCYVQGAMSRQDGGRVSGW